MRSGWDGASLQFFGGRAIVGLVGQRGQATRLALRRQRPSGAFGAIRVFHRVPEKLEYFGGSAGTAQVLVAPDGRGGHVAVLRRGRSPRLTLQLVRKPRTGRLRGVLVRRGPAWAYRFSMPADSPDGWAAVAFERLPTITDTRGVGYVLAARPSGSSIITRVAASDAVSFPAVSVTRGGTGVAGFLDGRFVLGGPFLTRASFVPLAAGLPQPSDALIRDTSDQTIQNVVMTSNRRDRARVVWEEGRRVLASLLR